MTTTYTIEHYGPNGLISSEVVTLNGEEELAYLAPERLRNAYATLRQWSTDAANEATAWPTQNAAQRDAAMVATFNRLSTFFDRFSDLLLHLGRT